MSAMFSFTNKSNFWNISESSEFWFNNSLMTTKQSDTPEIGVLENS